MTSNIDPTAINTNVPVANSDNPSQALRDNFSQISAQFATAAAEISGLQNTTIRLDGSVQSNTVVLSNDPNGTLVLTRLKPTSLAYSFDVPGTGAMRVPVGNTAQRPQSTPLAPAKGMIRYNTDTDTLEFYQAPNWVSLTGGGPAGPAGPPGPPGPAGPGPGGGSAPGGPDRSLQFNNSGVLDGDGSLTFDGTQLVAGKLKVDQVEINNDVITNVLSSGVLNLNAKGHVNDIRVRNPGGGYTAVPAITVEPPALGGIQATAEARMGAVLAVPYNRGQDYVVGDILTVTGGVTGVPTQLRVDTVRIKSATIDTNNRGVGYKPGDELTVVGGFGPAPATIIVSRVSLRDPGIVNSGRGYVDGETLTVFGGSAITPATVVVQTDELIVQCVDAQFTATAGQTVFDLTTLIAAGDYSSVRVYINTSLRTQGVHYNLSTVGGITRVTFTSPRSAGENIYVWLNRWDATGTNDAQGREYVLSRQILTSEVEDLYVSVDNVRKRWNVDYTLAASGLVTKVVFNSPPPVGSNVKAILGGEIVSVSFPSLASAGSYRELPNTMANTVVGGSGTGALLEFNTQVDQVLLQNQGPYEILPDLTNNKVIGGSGFGAYFDLVSEINTLTIPDPGSYSFLPVLTENVPTPGPGVTGTGATVNLSYGVTDIVITNNGTMYERSPQVNVTASPSGNNARLNAEMTGATVKVGDLIVQGTAVGTAPVVTNVIYVTRDGDDANDGLSEDRAKRTVKAAAAIAKPYTTIFIRAGDYVEDNPIYIPERVGVIGDNLRRVNLYYGNPSEDFFWVNNSVYIAGVSFRGGKAPGYAIAFPPLSHPYLPPGVKGGAGRIVTSPYVQNCTCFNSTGGGMLVDGKRAQGLKSMVLDAFTQFNQGGPGIHITNQGYAQLVSIFTICTSVGTWIQNGGTCSISNSNTSFGDIGILSEGTSPYLFGGKIKTGTGRYRVDNITVNQIQSRPYVGLVATIGDEISYVEEIVVTEEGQGYTSAPLVVVDPPVGYSSQQATAIANVNDGQITSMTITNNGAGYTGKSYITIWDPSGEAPPATTIVYRAQAVTITNPGVSYKVTDLITIDGGIYPSLTVDTPTILRVTSVGALGNVTGVDFGGAGNTGNYVELPLASGATTLTNGLGKGFRCSLDYGIYQIQMDPAGDGYTRPLVTISGSGSVTTRASADFNPDTGTVTGISLINQGDGYISQPAVTIEGGGGKNATAVSVVENGSVVGLRVTNPGENFTSTPDILIEGGGGSGARAGTIYFGVVYAEVNNGGSGYKANDILYVSGGTASPPATFRVTEVNASGTVKSVEIDQAGLYSMLPSSVASPTTVLPMGGLGCLLNISLGVFEIGVAAGGSSYQPGPRIKFLGGGAESLSFASGKAYYAGTSSLISGQESATIATINFVKSLLGRVLSGTPIAPLQLGISQVTDPALVSTGDFLSLATNAVSCFMDLITGFIDTTGFNGYSEAPFDSASVLLAENKAFLQAEAEAYVMSTYPGLLDETKMALCKRDVGLIVDAVCSDIRIGGWIRSLRAGRAYWNGAVSLIPGETVDPTVSTLEYVRDLAINVVQNNVIGGPRQGTVAQVTDGTLTGGIRAVSNLQQAFDVINYIIFNNTDFTRFETANQMLRSNIPFLAAEAVQFVRNNYPSLLDSTNQSKCARDIGYIIEAVSGDLIGIGGSPAEAVARMSPKYLTVKDATPLVPTGVTLLPNTNDLLSLSFQAGIIYSSFAFPAPEVAPTQAAFTYAKAWSRNLIKNTTSAPVGYPGSPYQVTATPIQNVSLANGINADSAVVAFFDNIIRFIGNGGNRSAWTSAGTLISTNQSTLKTNVSSWVNTTYPGLLSPTKLATCERDVGLIVDALAADLTAGTISYSLRAGRAYWNGVIRLIPGNPGDLGDTVAPTISAITYLESLVNTLVAPYNSTVGGTLALCFNVMRDIILNGPAQSGYHSASQLLRLNKTFLQEEISSYVGTVYPGLLNVEQAALCKRDVGYIVDAVAGDLVGAARSAIGPSQDKETTVSFEEATDYAALDGERVNFYQVSVASASSHTFEYVGAGTDINTCLPQLGGVAVQEKEVVTRRGGRIYYTSTDHKGDFRIGDGLVINQNTGTLSGRVFAKSLFGIITPFILSIESTA